jgi:nitroimidazol reductase NimA-like FMN-containing flavoprotein (pyridoxamine 5'-phosphate oxidase superfamily)
MRRKNKEIKDPAIIESILKNSLICRLGIRTDDVPYIVPVNYGYQDDTIYIHSAPEGRKIELLKKNNRVSFEIEFDHEIIREGESCDWTTKFRSLMGIGTVEIVNDYEEKIKGLDILMKQHGKYENTYKRKLVEFALVLKLHIEEVTGKQSGDW